MKDHGRVSDQRGAWRFAVLVPFLLGLGCGAGPAAEREPAATAPVLAEFQLRAERLTVYGDGGPRFTVTGRDGRVLAQGLTLSELRTRHPALSQTYETSMAGRTLDASLSGLPATERAPTGSR